MSWLIGSKTTSDQKKANLIRDKLIKWTSLLIGDADELHLVMRINGKDIRYECKWIMELLK